MSQVVIGIHGYQMNDGTVNWFNGTPKIDDSLIFWNTIINAIPGSTNAQKMAWVQNASHDVGVFRDTDAAARAMAQALGEIEAVIDDVNPDSPDWGLLRLRIAEIVAGVK